jgi:hypothetical protein
MALVDVICQQTAWAAPVAAKNLLLTEWALLHQSVFK